MKVLHFIVIETDSASFGLDEKLAYERRVTVTKAKEGYNLQDVLDAIMKLTAGSEPFEAIRLPPIEPPTPLYKAKVKSQSILRDQNGIEVGRLFANDIASVYREEIRIGPYSNRAVITMPGVLPEKNIWRMNLEKLNG